MSFTTRRGGAALRLSHLVAGGAFGLGLLAAAGLPRAASDPAGDSAAARLETGVSLIGARRLYLESCGGCHGPRGTGSATVATDFSAAQALVRLTRAAMEASLRDGHGGRVETMPGPEDTARILDYVRTYLMLPAPDADAGIGRRIYSESCSVCHGDRGNAASWARNSLNPPPADFTSHSLGQLGRDEMIDAVTFGEDGTAMMPFAVQLSRAEIAATVDYIRSAFMSEAAAAAAPGHDHGHGGDGDSHGHHGGAAAETADGTFPGGLRGDPAWGRAFYNANCAECHGRDGDGQGPRAYFMIVKPENFLSREARAELDREELFEYISEGVAGTTMPAWEKVLTPQQRANVGEYVFRAFLRPDLFAEAADGAAPAAPQWRPAGEDTAPAHDHAGHGAGAGDAGKN